MIPLVLTVNGVTKNLWSIFEPDANPGSTEEEKIAYAHSHLMFPTEVKLTSETYCRNSDRTANYELKKIMNVNAKAKPEFTWDKLKATYVRRLLAFLNFKYDYKDGNGNIQPEEAPTIGVQYMDFAGMRTIEAYLGATIDGTLVEYLEAFEGLIYSLDPITISSFSNNVEYALTKTPEDAGVGSVGSIWTISNNLNQGNQIKVRIRSVYDNEQNASYACSGVDIEYITDDDYEIRLYRTTGEQGSETREMFKTLSSADLAFHSSYLTLELLITPAAVAQAISAAFGARVIGTPYVGQKRVQYWENFRIAFPER